MAFIIPFNVQHHQGNVQLTSARAGRFYDSPVRVYDAKTGERKPDERAKYWEDIIKARKRLKG